ncbi:MAG TPA: GNAT family N-acetyltransferase [Gaiellaceae bacterium]|jgi:ribosomal protein S18 acetylase RimI-like enzyme|nr:GNAT family N-acetyltransferase [Gaiellaceae bacterium]
MTIRAATTDDHDLLRELWEEFEAELGGDDYLKETWEEAWEDLSETIGDGVALIAEEDGRAVGFIFCVLGDRGRKTAHVTDLYVRPEARSRGIGRALLAELITPARESGLAHVSLEVLVHNSDARRLYERLGFTPVDLFMVAPLGAFAERVGSDERPQSYGSLHVQTDDEAGVERAVTQFMPRLGRTEWTNVARAGNGWVTVTDALCDRDRSAQRRLGTELSERMGVPVVAFALEEESVVRFLLFDRGRMVDEYLSVPTYYGDLNKADELSLAANPTLVARLTGAEPGRVRAVARTASSPSELPPARELLEQVAAVMNLEARIER